MFVAFQLIISESIHALPSMNSSYKRPNYNFWISQGSVATVSRRGGLNYNHLRQVSSRCRLPKINKIDQCFTELFKKSKWHVFYW